MGQTKALLLVFAMAYTFPFNTDDGQIVVVLMSSLVDLGSTCSAL